MRATYKQDFYAETPALVENQLGEGTAYYLAARTDLDFLEVFYQPIIEKLQLQQGIVKSSNPKISIQSRTDGTHCYYFLMNFSEERQQLELLDPYLAIETNQTLTGIQTFAPYEVKILRKEN